MNPPAQATLQVSALDNLRRAAREWDTISHRLRARRNYMTSPSSIRWTSLLVAGRFVVPVVLVVGTSAPVSAQAMRASAKSAPASAQSAPGPASDTTGMTLPHSALMDLPSSGTIG